MAKFLGSSLIAILVFGGLFSLVLVYFPISENFLILNKTYQTEQTDLKIVQKSIFLDFNKGIKNYPVFMNLPLKADLQKVFWPFILSKNDQSQHPYSSLLVLKNKAVFPVYLNLGQALSEIRISQGNFEKQTPLEALAYHNNNPVLLFPKEKNFPDMKDLHDRHLVLLSNPGVSGSESRIAILEAEWMACPSGASRIETQNLICLGLENLDQELWKKELAPFAQGYWNESLNMHRVEWKSFELAQNFHIEFMGIKSFELFEQEAKRWAQNLNPYRYQKLEEEIKPLFSAHQAELVFLELVEYRYVRNKDQSFRLYKREIKNQNDIRENGNFNLLIGPYPDKKFYFSFEQGRPNFVDASYLDNSQKILSSLDFIPPDSDAWLQKIQYYSATKSRENEENIASIKAKNQTLSLQVVNRTEPVEVLKRPRFYNPVIYQDIRIKPFVSAFQKEKDDVLSLGNQFLESTLNGKFRIEPGVEILFLVSLDKNNAKFWQKLREGGFADFIKKLKKSLQQPLRLGVLAYSEKQQTLSNHHSFTNLSSSENGSSEGTLEALEKFFLNQTLTPFMEKRVEVGTLLDAIINDYQKSAEVEKTRVSLKKLEQKSEMNWASASFESQEEGVSFFKKPLTLLIWLGENKPFVKSSQQETLFKKIRAHNIYFLPYLEDYKNKWLKSEASELQYQDGWPENIEEFEADWLELTKTYLETVKLYNETRLNEISENLKFQKRSFEVEKWWNSLGEQNEQEIWQKLGLVKRFDNLDGNRAWVEAKKQIVHDQKVKIEGFNLDFEEMSAQNLNYLEKHLRQLGFFLKPLTFRKQQCLIWSLNLQACSNWQVKRFGKCLEFDQAGQTEFNLQLVFSQKHKSEIPWAYEKIKETPLKTKGAILCE